MPDLHFTAARLADGLREVEAVLASPLVDEAVASIRALLASSYRGLERPVVASAQSAVDVNGTAFSSKFAGRGPELTSVPEAGSRVNPKGARGHSTTGARIRMQTQASAALLHLVHVHVSGSAGTWMCAAARRQKFPNRAGLRRSYNCNLPCALPHMWKLSSTAAAYHTRNPVDEPGCAARTPGYRVNPNRGNHRVTSCGCENHRVTSCGMLADRMERRGVRPAPRLTYKQG
jgi:hypothetical protein